MGVSLMNNAAITFSQEDLPAEGFEHARPLYVTVECKDLKIPVVLVDNGSALNVCPMHTATKLGITEENLSPSAVTVRGYDNGCRSVMGTFKILCKVGPVESMVEFCVMDIPANYNLLLGRTWLHPLQVVPSTVHQKIKLPWGRGILVIHGDREITEQVLGIKEENSELE